MTPKELRNSILQLAIQGKLVEQRPEEGTSLEIYKQLKAEKQAQIKAGLVRKSKALKEPTTNDVLFEIPDSWNWIKIGEIAAVVTKGTTPRGGNISYLDSGVGFLRAENVAGYDKLDKSNLKYVSEETHFQFLKRSILQENDILITIAGTLGRTAIVKNEDLPLNANQAVSIVRLINTKVINLLYMVYALNSPEISRYLTGQKKITAIPNLTLEIIGNCVIPFPPPAEQDRIVAKIEELGPYIDRYEETWNKLEELNKHFPDDIKKSILQGAVQGKLVQQDSKEESAKELLKRISTEKRRFIREKIIKCEKNSSIIYRGDDGAFLEMVGTDERDISDEIPFEIPESWEWSRLGQLVYNHGQVKPNDDFCYIDIGSIDNRHQTLNSVETVVSTKNAPSRARKIVKDGDILYSTVRPYLHNMCIIDKSFSLKPIASTGFAVFSCHDGFYNKFLFYYLMSPCFDSYVNNTDNAKGVAYPAINDDRLYRALIPVPPHSEQNIIVEVINSLLSRISIL